MTKEEKAFKLWLPTVSFILLVGVYVWSSATRFQVIDSRSLENKADMVEFKKDTKEDLKSINTKLDVLIRRKR